MGTISCHSNQSSYSTGINNTIYEEANVLSMYAKFRLHPLYGFCEEFFKLFNENRPFCRPDNKSNSTIWTKVI